MITRIEIDRTDRVRPTPRRERWYCTIEAFDAKLQWWHVVHGICRWRWCAYAKARAKLFREWWRKRREARREARR